MMDRKELKNILQTLFFITDKPISVNQLKEIFADSADSNTSGSVTDPVLLELIDELKKESINQPIELCQIAEGYQYATRPQYSPWVKKLFKDKTTLRLSISALETLSIIAYKQPTTRAEIEEIRGVEVISVLETLLERKLVKIVGRKETVGRPLLYGTTMDFLRYFGLRNLSELPSLEEPESEGEPSVESD